MGNFALHKTPAAEMECTWFENWFDSNYYHILYGDRNELEAEAFLDNLLLLLKPAKGAHIHDLCCGRGRHAILLNKKGYEVTGTDLSSESIHFARQFENKTLAFFVSDMREPGRIDYFDYVFNLFTSFGYFNSDEEHEQVIRAVHASLKPGGIFVLDYLNSTKAVPLLKPFDTKQAKGIEFRIHKSIEKGYIVKDIQFEDKGKKYHFMERVRAYSLADFELLLNKNGFHILSVKGDYALHPFNPAESDRLILIAQKS
jgi:SAM-dependent methyltransferase